MAEIISVTIRGLPVEVHRQLTIRAARHRQSLQEYLLGELSRIAARPAPEDVLDRVRARKAATGTKIPAKRILGHRDADRK